MDLLTGWGMQVLGRNHPKIRGAEAGDGRGLAEFGADGVFAVVGVGGGVVDGACGGNLSCILYE